MIRKGAYGVSPTVEVVIGNVSFDYTSINRVELHLAENQHDMLVLTISGIPPRAVTEYYGKPVQFNMYVGGNFSENFVGYVEDVRPESFTGFGLMNNSPFQECVIVCMGASYVMRGKASNTWNGYRLSDIARELSAKYGFSVDAPSDRAVNESLLQTGESDWQFLTRYATFLGYSVSLHGTHLHVYDPYAALSRQNSFHVLTTLNSKDRSINPTPGQIIEFKGSFSSRHVDGDYKESTIAIVGEDNTVYDVSSTTLEPVHNGVARYPNKMTEYTDNFEEASRRINSESKSNYDYYADVRVIGIAGCAPGGIVRIDNYNSDFDTYWYVQEVNHTIHSDAFYTDLRIAVNKRSELKFTNTAKYQTPPVSVYRNGRWEARDRLVNEYS